MKLGLVGLSGSGKTTVFNALTHRSGEAPPTGGKLVPVLGVVPVPDPRVDWLAELYKPKKRTYAQVTYMDLQGMPGVAEQKREYMSLLLTHMRPMDAFLVVIRNFDYPGQPAPDPAREFQEIEEEFLLADLATVEKRLEKLAVDRRKGKKSSQQESALLEQCAALLNEERPLRSRPELAAAPELKGYTFLSAKPILVIVNNADEDDHLPPVSFSDAEVMVVRGKLEMEMAQLSPEEVELFQDDFGIKETALNRVIRRSFQLLNLVTFLTVGPDEVKAWTIPQGISALEAAGEVHSDIQRGFIRAEVVAFEDLKRTGDYAAARKEGLVRLEGKTYPVQDGDVIYFRFNV